MNGLFRGKKPIPVVAKNLITCEEIEFGSMAKAATYFSDVYGNTISSNRINGIINQHSPFHGEWVITCKNKEDETQVLKKNQLKKERRKSVMSVNLLTGEIQFYKAISQMRMLLKERGVKTTDAKIKKRIEDKTILEDTWRVSCVNEKITISDEQLKEIEIYNTELDLYDKEGRFYKRFKSVNDVAFFLQKSSMEVMRMVGGKKSTRGYKVFKKDEIPPWELEEGLIEEAGFISYGGKGKYKRIPIIAYNIKTYEELFFKSGVDLSKYFEELYNVKNIAKRMPQLIEAKKPYRNEWIFSYYYEEEYKC